jgi:hypothetical protein
MASEIPENTYDITVKVRITLPKNETPGEQDITLLLTGEDWDPWPGVQIHGMELLTSEPVTA